jgi:hypothetical protein
MANNISPRPSISVDGVVREMTEDEFSDYNKINDEVNVVVDSKMEKIQNRELVVAKLVALGITEQDLRAIGI